MKGQKKSSRRRSPEERQEDPDYVQLRDLSGEVRPRTVGVLGTLTALGISTEALRQAGIMEQPIQRLLAEELSCSRYFRWAFVDNFAEKILQGLILNKQDVSQEEINFCKSMIRQVPSGRSLLLHHACALRKVYAARGFVLTTEMVLNQAVKISIAFFLSYRLYEGFTADNSDFLGLTTIFEDNSKKGVNSLVNVLAKVPSEQAYLLYLLLTSPAIIGVLKGLWDTRKSQLLTEDDITKLREAVDYHTNTSVKRSYLLWDVLRQLIPIPGLSSVSERVQKLEQQLRWDGRIEYAERDSLFSNIERLALCGTGMSQINAMQSLAKIVHSFSIKDFQRLQQAGYRQETLLQILRIKAQALHDLRRLANGAGVQPEAQQNSEAALQRSFISRGYATYLLWWLGMGNAKSSLLFWPFKLGKLTLEALFLKTIVESILEAIRCPDKKYFDLRSGEFDVRANDLTADCFKEFVRQFRLLSQEELFEPFLAQLNNFDFTEVESIDLSNKALNSNETIKILNILKNKSAPIKILNLAFNKINDTFGLWFPNSLQSLDLSWNNISDEGAKGLRLPIMLRYLDLGSNNISDNGAKELQLLSLSMLTYLDLSYNDISNEGVKLQLPLSLTSLDLGENNIKQEGAKGLQLLALPMLKSLDLRQNHIGSEGAKGLQLPSMLKSLNLYSNNIGNEGLEGLQLLSLSMLTYLDLSYNDLSTEGIKGLQLPLTLLSLSLWGNNIGDEGIKRLQFPSMLQFLNLGYSNISAEGVKGLQLPSTLISLSLWGNNIGDEGAKELQFLDLPMLKSLDLRQNHIGSEGAKGLQLPSMLTFLSLEQNHIGSEGAKGLQLPSMLTSLSLDSNNISDEGAKGLQFRSSLESLSLVNNNISAKGTKELQLFALSMLTYLDLGINNISNEGAKELQLPSSLKYLNLSSNNIGDEGVKGLQLPTMLQFLSLFENSIGDEGVNALLQKIPRTNLTTIILFNNPYNSTAINRTLQQKGLLKNCQDILCYADTSLSQDAYQTSSATRTQPPLFFSWLKKPFDKLAEYASDCMSATLDSVGARLEKVLSQSPSYFPSIHSPVINDWQPSGSLMLHQFKTGGSNALLLSAPQTVMQPSFRTIAR